MKNKLVILENDAEITHERNRYVYEFKENFDGEVLLLTNLRLKEKDEIFKALFEATHIAAETAVVNGSERQFHSVMMMLAKIKEPKNIYIKLMGDDLKEYISDNLEKKEVCDILHHNIYELSCHVEINPHVLIDLSSVVKDYLETQTLEKQYRDSAINRPTGRKIKVLGCLASGKAFGNLTIGETVDELDMSEQEPNANRGVWIQGNGEPIKLINDCGIQEYQIVSKLTPIELMVEIQKSTYPIFDIAELNPLMVEGLLTGIEDERTSSLDKANFICENLDIPKRSNRAKIRNLLNQ